jgi:hypothetical protein
MDEITLYASLRPDGPDEAELNTMRADTRRKFIAGVRPRRKRKWLASGLATMTAAATAAAVLLTSGGGPPTAHQTTVVTAAWTVRENANGTVTVRISQFEHPARLQRVLRDDGINAFVAVDMHVRSIKEKSFILIYPSCVYRLPPANRAPQSVQQAVVSAKPVEWTIHPAAMPPGYALFLAAAVSDNVTYVMVPLVLTNDKLPVCKAYQPKK